MKTSKFDTKARTLQKLKLYNSIVPKLLIINCKNYLRNKRKNLLKIQNEFKGSKVCIRSSFNSEDNYKTTGAGKYKSFLNINPKNLENLNNKINLVINSKKYKNKNEHFFVQKFIEKVRFSGVVLTRNLENYSKCININFNDGEDTEVVTSGKENSKTLVYFENKKFSIPKKFKKLYISIKEIRKYFKGDLDIEFAQGKNNKIYIFQVRKLILPKNKITLKYDQSIQLKNLEKKVKKLKQKHYGLFGKTTYFGNMPDWNPAEIIGIKPRPLALSLYQELITNHVWSEHRNEYGYKDLSQFHLMTTFFGTPFVDVRIDFNSWLPKKLNYQISNKIINYYLNKFSKNQSAQDKVEFKILFTCATFNSLERINKDLKNILNKKEIKIFYNELKKINQKALKKISNDKNLINELKNKQELVNKSNLYEIDKIYWLVEDCKKFGTLPFAGLARCAFISIELLNSLVATGNIGDKEKHSFLSTIKTVTSEIKSDYKKLNKKKFIDKYGHLRPGTYDITSKNYKDGFQMYFNSSKNSKILNNKKINLSSKIRKALGKLGIYKNPNQVVDFIRDSIIGREYSKFIFTKSIDLIFQNLEKFGKKFDISLDDLSYIKIDKVLDMYFNLNNSSAIKSLKKHIQENKEAYNSNILIDLPDVIVSSKDLYIRNKKFDKINFISDKKISAKVIKFDKNNIKKNYDGIIFIENADPGFDFLFNKNIKGLVTKYGGLNSHMSIRCYELNLPALIGVGEKNFNRLSNQKVLNLDCVSKKIEFIN